MTQDLLNQAVAEATGEELQTINQRGFVPLTSRPIETDTDSDDREPLVVDWDELDLERYLDLCG